MAAIELVLRATSGAVPGHVYLVLGGASDAPQVVFEATVSGQIALSGSVAVAYENAVNRGVVQETGLLFNALAAKKTVNLSTAWSPSQFKPVDKWAVWQAAKVAGIDVRPRWQRSQVSPMDKSVPWRQGKVVVVNASTQWQKTNITPLNKTAWWNVAHPVDAVAALVFDYAKFTPQSRTALWDGLPKPVNKVLGMPFDDKAKVQNLSRIAPWDAAKTVSSYGGTWSFVVIQNPPPYVQPRTTNLILCKLLPRYTNGVVALLLGGDRCAVAPEETEQTAILPARVYMTVHNVFAQLLPSMANVPIYDATLSADVGSFAWSFSANGPESLFTQLARTSALPVQIKLTIDGLEWVFLVETLRRTAAFGKHGVAITGRSVTALVGDPWMRSAAYNNGSAMTAQQIAAQALDLSGVALDWGITDWLVPAGAWSHNGSRLSAVQRVAEAAGGYLQSHRSAATLQVRHPYPLLPGGVPGGPWNWASVTPDIQLAADAVITSGRENKDGPDINVVYVGGTNQGGFLVTVKRLGTAGEKPAGLMIADSLVTHVDAANQRGLSILGTAGAKEHVTLELPVLTGSGQPGVIDVGKLVQVNESVPWRGRVRSVNVAYNRPNVRQTITLERHL
jgi:hypothetical protein